MPYIGQSPSQVAFLTDTFSGNGSTTAFNSLSVAPANTASVLVAISGVVQDPSTYSVSGSTITFSAAPPTGTNNISCRYLGIPASGVTTTAYRALTTFTATAGQTTFSPPSYTAGFINVYRNGVLLTPTSDYTATNGTTVVLASGATSGDTVIVESFYVSSVLNAIPASTGAVSSGYIASGAVGTTQIAPSVSLTTPTMTTPTISSGSILNSNGRPMAAQTGGILQVVQANTTSTFSSTSTGSWVSTGFSASITPSSTSSKILVTIQLSTGQSTSGWSTNWGIQRNGTQIGGGVSTSGAPAYFWIATDAYSSDNEIYGLSQSYIDSPATTSAVTYLLTYYGEGNTGYLNRQQNLGSGTNNATGISTITLMEIAQ